MKYAPTENTSQGNVLAIGIVVTLGILALAAAVNGGTALSSSAWADSIITWIKTNFLASTFLIMLATIMTVVGVSQMVKGGNYGWLLLGLGVIVVAVLAPSWWTTVSTSVPTEQQMLSIDLSRFVQKR